MRRFAAYDALAHEFSADDLRHIREDEWRAHNQQYKVPNASMPAMIGNMLSHFEIWRSLLRMGDPYLLVMEDDVILLKDDFTAEVSKLGEKDCGKRFGYRAAWEATFTLKRTDFGMSYGVEQGILGDEVRVTLALEGVRK